MRLFFFSLIILQSFQSVKAAKEFVHDPSAFFVFDDRLIGYASGTEGIPLQGIELVLAEKMAEHFIPVFEEEVPDWVETIQIWNQTNEFDAPATHKQGKYIFYTVYDETDEEGLDFNIQDAIAVAENLEDPQEPEWKDLGIVVQSKGESLDMARTMDPAVLEDDGKLYLFFGSHAGGIFLTELNPATLKLKSQPEKTSTSDHQERFVHLAQHMSPEGEESEIEAPYLFKNGDYYYLFVNWGGCCNGTKSTYNVRMGRSKNILGPYLDRKQKDMRDGGGTLFLERDGRYIGPGHVGIVEFEEQQIITYHYYDGGDDGVSKLAARELFWNDKDWPELGDHLILPN